MNHTRETEQTSAYPVEQQRHLGMLVQAVVFLALYCILLRLTAQ
jgi:hypothetical protein